MLPLIPIIISVSVSAWVGRKAHDVIADHPSLCGYCSNCGNTTQHHFYESGMSWKKSCGTTFFFGLPVLAVSSVLARNIYKCGNCEHLTLTCRMPGCKGMALCGEYYDDEFCGDCRKKNDNSKLYNAFQDQKTLAKVSEILKTRQTEIEILMQQLKSLEIDRAKNKELIRRLSEALEKKNIEVEELKRMVGQ